MGRKEREEEDREGERWREWYHTVQAAWDTLNQRVWWEQDS